MIIPRFQDSLIISMFWLPCFTAGLEMIMTLSICTDVNYTEHFPYVMHGLKEVIHFRQCTPYFVSSSYFCVVKRDTVLLCRCLENFHSNFFVCRYILSGCLPSFLFFEFHNIITNVCGYLLFPFLRDFELYVWILFLAIFLYSSLSYSTTIFLMESHVALE